jgi:hypothetical protein
VFGELGPVVSVCDRFVVSFNYDCTTMTKVCKSIVQGCHGSSVGYFSSYSMILMLAVLSAC